MRVSAFKNLAVDEEGKKVVFEAGGATYVQHLGVPHRLPKKVPVLHEDAPYYSPSFIAKEDFDLVLHARWSDTNFTSFEIAHVESGRIREVSGLPIGRYLGPIVDPNQAANRFYQSWKRLAYRECGRYSWRGSLPWRHCSGRGERGCLFAVSPRSGPTASSRDGFNERSRLERGARGFSKLVNLFTELGIPSFIRTLRTWTKRDLRL